MQASCWAMGSMFELGGLAFGDYNPPSASRLDDRVFHGGSSQEPAIVESEESPSSSAQGSG
jgi:hypothetical protein